jgi:hypothetical protein
MSAMAQLQIAYEMWKDWLRATFGGNLYFPTAPGGNYNYVK